MIDNIEAQEMVLKSEVYNDLASKIPGELAGIMDLAFNTAWTWNTDARRLFKEINFPLWRKSRHNPIKMIKQLEGVDLDHLTKSDTIKSLYTKAIEHHAALNQNHQSETWFARNYPQFDHRSIAYLSMEYGLHVSLPIYSGGLGILSGDHLKASSDLGVPIMAVGFLYEEGYFSQRVPAHGWQEAVFHQYDRADMPLFEVMDPEDNDKPLLVHVDFNDIQVHLKVWLVKVGRVNLFLMDANVDQNSPWDQDLTNRLYGGGSDLRLKQEMMLGIGAVRIFNDLGIEPAVWHLNEGHCSFSSVERIHQNMKSGSSFQSALEKVQSNTLFTTHTPVSAGHDVFEMNLIKDYCHDYYIKDLGEANFFDLGLYEEGGFKPGFNMTTLGMRTSTRFNGVAALHKEVSKKMFLPLWDELRNNRDDKFNPITHVTNGIHVPSFLSGTWQKRFDQIDFGWRWHFDNPDFWNAHLPKLSNSEIWEQHNEDKIKLMRMMRRWSRAKMSSGLWHAENLPSSGLLMDERVFTIGFARRFATYKRADLIFRDFDRIKKILTDDKRPVQIIFAGKAHPADDGGKRLIQRIMEMANLPELQYRIAFIEDYDLIIAKALLQGVDLWLNNPIRPHEASGTSGMKAACNFVPNLSILDGWWAEGYLGSNGWAINPENKEFDTQSEQDDYDANSIYQLLEKEIVPAYYGRDTLNVPQDYVNRMRQAFITSVGAFSARRMLKDYCLKLYNEAL